VEFAGLYPVYQGPTQGWTLLGEQVDSFGNEIGGSRIAIAQI
jgi:hypothetical protein